MGSILFIESSRHVHPKLALNSVIAGCSSNINFRSSYDPDHNAAEDITLGTCLKEFLEFNQQSQKIGEAIANNHHPETNTADYVNLGQDGYLRLESQLLKNNKRGTSYRVVVKPPNTYATYRTIKTFDSKIEAESFAKKYAVEHLEQEVFIHNHKEEQVGSVYLTAKHYRTKPTLKPKDGRAVLPAYHYLFIGKAYIG